MAKLVVKLVLLLAMVLIFFGTGVMLGGQWATESIHQQMQERYQLYYGEGGAGDTP